MDIYGWRIQEHSSLFFPLRYRPKYPVLTMGRLPVKAQASEWWFAVWELLLASIVKDNMAFRFFDLIEAELHLTQAGFELALQSSLVLLPNKPSP